MKKRSHRPCPASPAAAAPAPDDHADADVFDLLACDHRALGRLVARAAASLDAGEPWTARHHLRELRVELWLHARAEADVVQRALADAGGDELAARSAEEHALLARMLDELLADDGTSAAAMRILVSLVAHHVERADSELFREGRARLGLERAAALAAPLRAARHELAPPRRRTLRSTAAATT